MQRSRCSRTSRRRLSRRSAHARGRSSTTESDCRVARRARGSEGRRPPPRFERADAPRGGASRLCCTVDWILNAVTKRFLCRKLCRDHPSSRPFSALSTRTSDLAKPWHRGASPISARFERCLDRIKSPLLYQLSYRNDIPLTDPRLLKRRCTKNRVLQIP
jgi:hypothetical protein